MGIYIFVIFLIVWFIIVYNDYIKQRRLIKEEFSNIDFYLKKRYDITPILLTVVKGYALYEFQSYELVIIEDIIEAKNTARKNKTQNKSSTEKEFSNKLNKMFDICKKYPIIANDTEYIRLYKELRNIEIDIEKAAVNYNKLACELNKKMKKVPGLLVASLFDIDEEPYFIFENLYDK